jgi:hypothetical protein
MSKAKICTACGISGFVMSKKYQECISCTLTRMQLYNAHLQGQSFSPQEEQVKRAIVTERPDLDAFTLTMEGNGRGVWDGIQSVVDVIKATIPASDRTYDKPKRTWTIINKHRPKLDLVLTAGAFKIEINKFIDPATFFYDNPIPTSSKNTPETIKEKLAVILNISTVEFSSSAADLLTKLYRRKALELHPDRNNGDGSRMSELNQLWSEYRENMKQTVTQEI